MLKKFVCFDEKTSFWEKLVSQIKFCAKGGFKSEETGVFLLLQDKYSKLLSWAEHLNFTPKTVNNLFEFSAQDSDLDYIFILEK